MTVTLKICYICQEALSPENFNSKRKECRNCSVGIKLEKRYGLTKAEYDEQLEAQNGVCKICKRSPEEVGKLHVDHDHDHCGIDKACSSCRRGLICQFCNTSLGLLEDDIERILRAAEYLKSYKEGKHVEL